MPPSDSRLLKFPTRESLGLIWALNGLEPDMDRPAFAVPEPELVVSTIHNKDMPVDCDRVFSNSMDFQHLKLI